MKINFAIKDLYHHKETTRSYLISNILTLAFFTVILNFTESLGILSIPLTITEFNRTMLDLSSQFNQFLILLYLFFMLFLLLNSNHAIIEDRSKDIATMRALGTYPREVYDFYIREIYVLVIAVIVIGITLGEILYFLFFISLENTLPSLQWRPDRFFIGIVAALEFVLPFLINGWELRKMGSRPFAQIGTNAISHSPSHPSEIHNSHSFSLAKRLSDISLSLVFAGKDFFRKKGKSRQVLFTIGLASSMVFISLLGGITVGTSMSTYIEAAQGQNIIAIGAKPIIGNLSYQYESFSNPQYNPEALPQETNLTWFTREDGFPQIPINEFTKSFYNLTGKKEDLQKFLIQEGLANIQYDLRLYSVLQIKEEKGYTLVNNETLNGSEYVWVGQGNRTRAVPVQGIVFGETVQHWYFSGAFLNLIRGAVIGDTLSAELFENSYLQGISLFNDNINRTYHFKIFGTVIDSLNAGNSVYISLEDLQEVLGKENYTNLLLLDISKELENYSLEYIYNLLSNWVSKELGDNFICLNLAPVFQQNIDHLKIPIRFMYVFGIVMVAVVFIDIIKYQNARIAENLHDYYVAYLMSGEKTFLFKTLLYQQLLLVFIGLSLGLIIGMAFTSLILLKDAILPAVQIPFLIYGVFLVGYMIAFIPLTKKWTNNIISEGVAQLTQ